MNRYSFISPYSSFYRKIAFYRSTVKVQIRHKFLYALLPCFQPFPPCRFHVLRCLTHCAVYHLLYCNLTCFWFIIPAILPFSISRYSFLLWRQKTFDNFISLLFFMSFLNFFFFSFVSVENSLLTHYKI